MSEHYKSAAEFAEVDDLKLEANSIVDELGLEQNQAFVMFDALSFVMEYRNEY